MYAKRERGAAVRVLSTLLTAVWVVVRKHEGAHAERPNDVLNQRASRQVGKTAASDQDAREPPVKAVVVEAAEHGVLLDDQNAARSAVGSDAQLAYERRVTRDLPHHLVEWLERVVLSEKADAARD